MRFTTSLSILTHRQSGLCLPFSAGQCGEVSPAIMFHSTDVRCGDMNWRSDETVLSGMMGLDSEGLFITLIPHFLK